MAKQQRQEVAPPMEQDAQFQDFASVIQSNLVDLFQVAHDHPIRTSVPTNSDGNIGDIIVVQTGGNYYLYCKVSADTWKRTAALV